MSQIQVATLVLLVSSLLAGVSAANEKHTHCEFGLCLSLTPGSETGFHPPSIPGPMDLPSEGTPRNVTREYLSIYFPRLPRSGTVYFRKLWEQATGTEAETVQSVGTDFLDRRTNAYAFNCGGLALLAEAHDQSGEGDPARCQRIHRAEGSEPVLIQSFEPVENTSPVFKDNTDLVLQLIRNPVDAYNSVFQARNPRFFETKNSADLQWKVSFPDYLNTIYLPYLTSFKSVAAPRVLMRYEDMYTDPVGFLKEVMVFTGTARATGLNAKGIREAVQAVNRAVAGLHKPGAAMGEGFKVVHGPNLDVAMQHLSEMNDFLSSLGYNYYLERDGQPAALENLRRFHIQHHQAVRDTIHSGKSIIGGEHSYSVGFGTVLLTGLGVAVIGLAVMDELHARKNNALPARNAILAKLLSTAQALSASAGGGQPLFRASSAGSLGLPTSMQSVEVPSLAGMGKWAGKIGEQFGFLSEFVGRRSLQASVISRASAAGDAAMTQTASEKAAQMTPSDIRVAIRETRKSETPAERLARLKQLRASLSAS